MENEEQIGVPIRNHQYVGECAACDTLQIIHLFPMWGCGGDMWVGGGGEVWWRRWGKHYYSNDIADEMQYCIEHGRHGAVFLFCCAVRQIT